MSPIQNSASTRDKILHAACRLFAEKGYRGARVTEICRQAGANIASISYYFGGKAALYQEAWKRAHGQLEADVPADGGITGARPATERLQGRIRAALQRAMLGDAIEFRIMRNEMANPTGLLQQVIRDTIRPLRRDTQAILRELLGPGCTDLDVDLCELCVVSSWMQITHRQQAEKHRDLGPVLDGNNLDTIAERLTAFALAGIAEIRRRTVPDLPATRSASSS